VLAILAAAAVHGILAGRNPTEGRTARAAVVIPVPAQHTGPADANAVAHDLSDIRFQREFRILVSPADKGRQSDPAAVSQRVAQARLLEKFADEQFLIPVWVPVERPEDLARSLLQGRGDVIATPLPTDDFPAQGVRPTVPVGSLRELMLARLGDRIDS
jgi:hypothetical protein